MTDGIQVNEPGAMKIDARGIDAADIRRQEAEALRQQSMVTVRHLTAAERRQYGVKDPKWFEPPQRVYKLQTVPRVSFGKNQIICNKEMRKLMGADVALSVNIGLQGLAYLVLHFSSTGKVAVKDRKEAYFITAPSLLKWLVEEGVAYGIYPADWDPNERCLHVRLRDGVTRGNEA